MLPNFIRIVNLKAGIFLALASLLLAAGCFINTPSLFAQETRESKGHEFWNTFFQGASLPKPGFN